MIPLTAADSLSLLLTALLPVNSTARALQARIAALPPGAGPGHTVAAPPWDANVITQANIRVPLAVL